jgi:hypothetical protein
VLIVVLKLDNAPICNPANLTVESKYLELFWTCFIMHSLNPALKSIASNVTWIGELFLDAHQIHIFAQNHTHALTIYKNFHTFIIFGDCRYLV